MRPLPGKGVAWVAFVLVGQASAGGEPPAADPDVTTREYRYLMGTSVEIMANGGSASERRAAVDEAFAAVAEVDRLMSNYRDDSELAELNRNADRVPVKVSAPLLSVLEAAQRVSALSDGAFDITVGPLVRLWGFHDKKAHVPAPEELARVRPLVGYKNLLIDESLHTARFARPGVELDLGGIAKGFAVELAANVLRKHGLTGLIDAGGNQYLLGHPPGKDSWRVGIKNPDAPNRLLGMLEVGECSVSTSAQNANYLTAGNRTYGHILDPRTLQPSDGALSATIISPDGTFADALSKVGFILGPGRGLDIIESFPQTAGLIAYRQPDGRIGIATSPRLRGKFHPTSAPP
ncbi:MAG TPA: FAD:protein FMN transferase [Vicinamibacteria bacterium]|nr:FAD:protein FMN transferase [Vicinamibacteria bacterium]